MSLLSPTLRTNLCLPCSQTASLPSTELLGYGEVQERCRERNSAGPIPVQGLNTLNTPMQSIMAQLRWPCLFCICQIKPLQTHRYINLFMYSSQTVLDAHKDPKIWEMVSIKAKMINTKRITGNAFSSVYQVMVITFGCWNNWGGFSVGNFSLSNKCCRILKGFKNTWMYCYSRLNLNIKHQRFWAEVRSGNFKLKEDNSLAVSRGKDLSPPEIFGASGC